MELQQQAGEGWAAAMELGPLGMAPWGDIQAVPEVAEVFPAMTAVHQWLAKNGIPPDFHADRLLRYTHRRIGKTDVYFVANGSAENFDAVCSFRIADKQPELWHPENGTITPLAAYEAKGGCTRVPLRFGPTESVFIVFRRPAEAAMRIVSATRNGQELLGAAPAAVGGNASADRPSLDLARGEIWQPGSYVFKTADGRSRRIDCRGLAAPLEIGGPWRRRV